jgi:uncharacterized protein YwqG
MKKNKIKLLSKEIKKLSKTKNYTIKIESKIDGIFESKIGGIPYWPPDKNYPTNSKGKKLFLLAQVNFDEEKVISPLPKNGILQFFINDDDLMGLNFDDQTKQDNFRVVYHETVDYQMTKKAIKKLGAIDCKKADNFPVSNEYKISLHAGTDYITLGDFHFNKFFSKAYKEVYKKDLKEDENYMDILEDYEINELEEEFETNKSNHKMLGYSFFTQEDPRYNKKYMDYDTLLFQIDSDEQYLMWGDVGVGNFFIPKKSLEEKDFSHVLYNWDCY